MRRDPRLRSSSFLSHLSGHCLRISAVIRALLFVTYSLGRVQIFLKHLGFSDFWAWRFNTLLAFTSGTVVPFVSYHFLWQKFVELSSLIQIWDFTGRMLAQIVLWVAILPVGMSPCWQLHAYHTHCRRRGHDETGEATPLRQWNPRCLTTGRSLPWRRVHFVGRFSFSFILSTWSGPLLHQCAVLSETSFFPLEWFLSMGSFSQPVVLYKGWKLAFWNLVLLCSLQFI